MFQELNSLLMGASYYGEWLATDGSTPPEFKNNKGFVVVNFSPEYWPNKNQNFHHQLFFRYYDGQYVDQSYIGFNFPKNQATAIIDLQNGYIFSQNSPY